MAIINRGDDDWPLLTPTYHRAVQDHLLQRLWACPELRPTAPCWRHHRVRHRSGEGHAEMRHELPHLAAAGWTPLLTLILAAKKYCRQNKKLCAGICVLFACHVVYAFAVGAEHSYFMLHIILSPLPTIRTFTCRCIHGWVTTASVRKSHHTNIVMIQHFWWSAPDCHMFCGQAEAPTVALRNNNNLVVISHIHPKLTLFIISACFPCKS